MEKLIWKTEQRKIKSLIPADYNPRKITDKQAADLRKSLEKFDIVEIPAIDTDGTILAGHQRIAMLTTMGRGEETIDVRVPNRKLTEAEAKEYNLRSNKNTGEWDMDKLFEMPKELLEDVGFDNKEIQKLIDSHTEATEDDYDVEEGLKTPVRVEKGDIWQLGSHRLMCGDSTAKEDVEKIMNGDNIAICLTDPPYGISLVKNGKVGADFGVAKKGEYEPIAGDGDITIARDALVLVKDLKMIVWGGNYFSDFLSGSDSWLIWDKRGDSGIRNTFADGEMAWCSFHTPVRIYKQLWNGMIREGEHEKRVHPTQKPIKMLTDIIKDFTDPSDIIIDLFGGSGSTLIACEQTGRSCYMMEIDPKYCTVILDRWEKLTGKQAEKL